MLSNLDLAVRLATCPHALEPSAHRALMADAGRPGMRARSRRGDSRPRPPGVAIIPVRGYLSQRPTMLGALGLGTSMDSLDALLSLALSDPGVDAIVLDIDSTGGEVYGMTETAAKIREARARKPVIGVANSVAASAAYWLLASCGTAYVTPSGQVGGVGMSMVHEDQSRALDAAGIHVTLISAGKYKTEGAPFMPLDADARGFMQQTCDHYFSMMVADIAKGRRVSEQVVRTKFCEGRTLGAPAAKAAGMVDGTRTFDQVLDEIRSGRAGQTTSQLAAQVAISRAMRG
jgi:signal peptide peptidase SppA